MYAQQIADFLSTPIPTAAAVGVGVFGLVSGAAFAVLWVREELAKARRLMAIDIRYKRRADDTYAKIRALTDPTCSVPVVVLFPPTRVERVRQAVAEAFERATWRGEKAAEWQDGELRLLIDQTADETPLDGLPNIGLAHTPTEAPVPIYRNRRSPSERVPARSRWTPRMEQLLGGPIPVSPLFASIRVPAQRPRATPLVMARLREDDTRQFRVKVVAA